MIPRINSCTPESSSTAAISEAQPAGGEKSSASPSAIATPTAPSALKAKPVTVLIRRGITEKFTNMFVHKRKSRRTFSCCFRWHAGGGAQAVDQCHASLEVLIHRYRERALHSE